MIDNSYLYQTSVDHRFEVCCKKSMNDFDEFPVAIRDRAQNETNEIPNFV